MPISTLSTSAYFAKQGTVIVMAAMAGFGLVMPMAWLPDEAISALLLGIMGSLLNLSVFWIVNSNEKPSLVKIFWIFVSSVIIAVAGNGIQLPFLDHVVTADALWRVNTLMLAFLGVSVPLFIKDLILSKVLGGPKP